MRQEEISEYFVWIFQKFQLLSILSRARLENGLSKKMKLKILICWFGYFQLDHETVCQGLWWVKYSGSEKKSIWYKYSAKLATNLSS
jgi:hypothetical protein